MQRKAHTGEDRIARIAARQHGVVTLNQLRMCGIGEGAVRWRVQTGRLYPVHRGVYALGHDGLTHEGRWKAATLAVPNSVLSHRSAGELWELLPPSDAHPHITVPYPASPAHRPDLRIHRSRTLGRMTSKDNIPVTMPSRTLDDLRRTAPEQEWRQATREAEYRGLPLGIETDHTRSEAEAAFLRLCRRHGIPHPEVNVRVGRFTVDFLWRAERLVVEVDGYRTHRGRQAFEDDRARDLELREEDLRVRRFTSALIARDPASVARSVLRALAAA
jgi:very-short-patch-repair endonuclease